MPVVIGGITVSCGEASAALVVLRNSPGMMVRQPLARHGSPLATCDYHAAAASYLDRSMAGTGKRGAAGRPLTKTAFLAALSEACDAAMLAERLEQQARERLAALAPGAVEEALAAFRTDHSYAALMADAAVAIMRRRHEAGLRAMVRDASAGAVATCSRLGGTFQCAATAPCGTGDCRLARGVLAGLSPSRPRQRGAVLSRPGNHVSAGAPFSPESVLEDLLERDPFRVAIAPAA